MRNPAFLYRSRVNYAHRRLDIDYDYTALADHVQLSALKQYQADRKRVYDDLGYILTKDPRIVWTVYMYRSQRVRATFTRRLTRDEAEVPASLATS